MQCETWQSFLRFYLTIIYNFQGYILEARIYIIYCIVVLDVPVNVSMSRKGSQYSRERERERGP